MSSGSHSRKGQKHREYVIGIRVFIKRLFQMTTEPLFIALTIVGNIVIFAGAYALYHVEFGLNPMIQSYLDSLWWAFSTVTTVGYGDVHPVTPTGRVIGIGMMIVGSALFWSYTGLFAAAVISSEISEVEMELHNIDRSLRRIDPMLNDDSHDVRDLIVKLEAMTEKLRKLDESKGNTSDRS